MSTKWTLIAAAALILTSCSAKPSVNSAPPGGPPPQSAQPPAAAPADHPKPAGDTDTQHQGQLETEPSAPQPPKETAKTYMLNPKTYDIVPIDPSATDKQVVLLTFDDGPKDIEMNQALLDTLGKHHAKAIFFLNGYRIKQKPELVKLLFSHGQTIGNHSWDHIDLKKESKEKIDGQLGDLQKAVKEVTGEAPRFFRPPFGSGSDAVRAKATEENMLYMTWSNGSKDWEMTVKNNHPDQVVANVLQQLRPGSNILMHELPWTVQALDELLTKLEEKGYGFVDPDTIDIKL